VPGIEAIGCTYVDCDALPIHKQGKEARFCLDPIRGAHTQCHADKPSFVERAFTKG